MRRIISLYIIIISIHFSLAQQVSSAAGTSSNLLLRFDASARASALSGAYTALADDENALFYNPAGLTKMYAPSFGLNHSEWLEDIRIDNIVYAQPISGSLVAAVGITHMWMPQIQGKDQYGNKTQAFDVSSSIVQAGLAYQLNRYFSTGLVLKYFKDNLAEFNASGWAGDAGIQIQPFSNRFSIGLAVQNLGSRIRYDRATQNIPFTYRAGLALELLPGRLNVAADITKSIDTDFRYLFGVSYTFQNLLTLRLGNRSSVQNTFLPSFGVGLKIKQQFQIDYAYSSLPDLGMTHKVGLSFRLGGNSRYRAFSQRTGSIYPPSRVSASLEQQILSIKWKRMQAVEYNVYARFGTKGVWTKLNRTTLGKNNYLSKIPLNSGDYYFRVTAVRSGLESVPSEIVVLHVDTKAKPE